MSEKKSRTSRLFKPTASEIKYEVMKMTQEISSGRQKDYELGVLNALKWVLGERKTLEKNDA